MNRPLDNILNSYNYDQLHEIPLSAYLSKGSQHLAGGLNRCGTPKGLAVTFALLPSVATTCVAVIETVAALAYAIFTTALHTLTFFQIDPLQNHVIKSWAFVRHSFLMVGAPFILLANTDNLDSESINLRTAFMRLNCAQTAQTIGTVFDALGCRCAHRSVSDLADERAMEAAIESLPKLFEIIEPNSFFNQQKVVKFFAADKYSLLKAEEFLKCCRLNDPNREGLVKDLLTAYKVYHQNDFFGNENGVPNPKFLAEPNTVYAYDEPYSHARNIPIYERGLYPPRAPLNHDRLNVNRFQPNRDDEMNHFDLQALAQRLEAEENAKMAAEEAESLRLARELQDQFDLDDHEAEQRELEMARQQRAETIDQHREMQLRRAQEEAEIRRKLLLQQHMNQVNNPLPPLVQAPQPIQVAPVIPVAQQIQEAKSLYLRISPPEFNNDLFQFMNDLEKNVAQFENMQAYKEYMLKLTNRAIDLLRGDETEIKKIIIPAEIDQKYIGEDGKIDDSFYEEDYFPTLGESLEDVAILTQFLEILNANPTCPAERNDRLQKLEAFKAKYNASSVSEKALFFIILFQRNHFENDIIKTDQAVREKLLEHANKATTYFDKNDVNDQSLTTILNLRESFNELGWGSFGTGSWFEVKEGGKVVKEIDLSVVNKDAYNAVVIRGLS